MAKQNVNGSGPQVKRRTAWVELPDAYEGFEVEVWVNAPTKLWMELQAPNDIDPDLSDDEQAEIAKRNEAKRQSAASKMVLAHNGWRDFDGKEYPPPSEPAFWEEIPTEMAACIFALANREMQTLPNSLAPKRRRSRRG